jgi:hypothetical protein
MPAKKYFPDKICLQCGIAFNRSLRPSGMLESTTEYVTRKYCSRECFTKHYRGKNNKAYKTGIRKNKDGYLRTSDDKYIHREMMELHLGRKLESHEFVHHIDGDPANNAIENLELTTNSEHRKEHAAAQSRGSDGRFVVSET